MRTSTLVKSQTLPELRSSEPHRTALNRNEPEHRRQVERIRSKDKGPQWQVEEYRRRNSAYLPRLAEGACHISHVQDSRLS